MSKTIDELFYGNISPNAQMRPSPAYRRQLRGVEQPGGGGAAPPAGARRGGGGGGGAAADADQVPRPHAPRRL